jgi:hypothetical protein
MMIRHAEIEWFELVYYLGNSLIGRFMGLEDEISNTPRVTLTARKRGSCVRQSKGIENVEGYHEVIVIESVSSFYSLFGEI